MDFGGFFWHFLTILVILHFLSSARPAQSVRAAGLATVATGLAARIRQQGARPTRAPLSPSLGAAAETAGVMGRGRPPNGAEWLTIQLCRAFEAHVLSEPEQAWAAPPLPAAFGSAAELYSSMKALVLDEAFAMVREGLASRKRAVTLRMRIDATLRASDRGARLGALSVTAVGASAPDLSSALRSGSVFLLSRGECQLLAVLDGRSQEGVGESNPNPNPKPEPEPGP